MLSKLRANCFRICCLQQHFPVKLPKHDHYASRNFRLRPPCRFFAGYLQKIMTGLCHARMTKSEQGFIRQCVDRTAELVGHVLPALQVTHGLHFNPDHDVRDANALRLCLLDKLNSFRGTLQQYHCIGQMSDNFTYCLGTLG
ncbi:hypothetical protein D3C77_397430 [compost metagenome]